MVTANLNFLHLGRFGVSRVFVVLREWSLQTFFSPLSFWSCVYGGSVWVGDADFSLLYFCLNAPFDVI